MIVKEYTTPAGVKVFFHDLASLDALYRVLSFSAFGLMLLVAAFLYLKLWHANSNKEEQS